MGVDFYWSAKKGVHLDHTEARSSFKEKLERMFGAFPITLKEGDLAKLSAAVEIEPEEAAWPELIKAIEKHHEILLEAHY